MACEKSAPPGPPNIVLIVMDTVRADRLSLYGHERMTTPRLEEFAKDAIVFDRAYATSSWTVASHGSLFTGLLPVTHQATQENTRLDEELDTLAELLSEAGYETAAFTNNSWISNVTSLSQGFEKLEPMWKLSPADVGESEAAADGERAGLAHATNRAVDQWLRSRETHRPFFLFINYIEAHWPYRPAQAHRDRFTAGFAPMLMQRSRFSAIQWYIRGRSARPPILAARKALYDATVRSLDDIIGELLDILYATVPLDNTLIVITSDHGENLGEHGHQGHSFSLYDATLRIPLLIRSPNREGAGTRRDDPVQLTDVFMTIARASGLEHLDPRAEGFDLLAGPVPADRPLIGEYYHPKTYLSRFPKTGKVRAIVAPFERRLRSIQVGPNKLIWGSDGVNEFYEMDVDPGELNNRIIEHPERVQALRAELDAIVVRLSREIVDPQGPISEMDPEAIERLRELGYLP